MSRKRVELLTSFARSVHSPGMDLSFVARGATPIELDRPRYLWYDVAATWLLIQRYGMTFTSQLYRAVRGPKPVEGGEAPFSLELVSMEALVFFLYVGLLTEARQNGEELTEQFVAEQIVPFNVQEIFLQVATAVARSNRPVQLPDALGKDEAAAAGPADVAQTARPAKGSTSKKRNASLTRSSDKRRKSSSGKR